MSTKFLYLPQILCVHVKRFVSVDKMTQKRFDWLDVPGSLNLNKCLLENATCPRLLNWPIVGPNAEQEELQRAIFNNLPKSPCQYRLVSSVHHHGSSWTSGHYTAVSRDASTRFFEFDDAVRNDLDGNWFSEARFAKSGILYFFELEV